VKDHNTANQSAKPVIDTESRVVEFTANAGAGIAEDIEVKLQAIADVPKASRWAAILISNPTGGNAIWLRKAPLAAVDAGLGITYAAGASTGWLGWEGGSEMLMQTDHAVYVLIVTR